MDFRVSGCCLEVEELQGAGFGAYNGASLLGTL